MKVYIEIVCYYNCDECKKAVFVKGSIPERGIKTLCPHCNTVNISEGAKINA